MGRAILHDDLATMFAERDRRLDNLENASRLASSSIRAGTLTIQDVQANSLGVFGTQTDGSQGILITDDSGSFALLQATGKGLLAPELQGAVRDPAAFKAVTGAGFVIQYQVIHGQIVSPAVEVYIGWSTDAATTGEVRLSTNGGAAVTDAFPLVANSSGQMFIRWLHQVPLLGGPLFLGVEARRVTGAGNVNIFQPAGWSRNPVDATIGGVLA